MNKTREGGGEEKKEKKEEEEKKDAVLEPINLPFHFKLHHANQSALTDLKLSSCIHSVRILCKPCIKRS